MYLNEIMNEKNYKSLREDAKKVPAFNDIFSNLPESLWCLVEQDINEKAVTQKDAVIAASNMYRRLLDIGFDIGVIDNFYAELSYSKLGSYETSERLISMVDAFEIDEFYDLLQVQLSKEELLCSVKFYIEAIGIKLDSLKVCDVLRFTHLYIIQFERFLNNMKASSIEEQLSWVLRYKPEITEEYISNWFTSSDSYRLDELYKIITYPLYVQVSPREFSYHPVVDYLESIKESYSTFKKEQENVSKNINALMSILKNK